MRKEENIPFQDYGVLFLLLGLGSFALSSAASLVCGWVAALLWGTATATTTELTYDQWTTLHEATRLADVREDLERFRL